MQYAGASSKADERDPPKRARSAPLRPAEDDPVPVDLAVPNVPTTSALSVLSERELQVFLYVARGVSLNQIAIALELTRKTVDWHKLRVMKKLDVHDRLTLTRLAIREGLLPVWDDERAARQADDSPRPARPICLPKYSIAEVVRRFGFRHDEHAPEDSRFPLRGCTAAAAILRPGVKRVEFRVEIVDVSRCGVSIRSDVAIALGTRVALRIDQHGIPPQEWICRVQHVYAGRGRQRRVGMRIEQTQLVVQKPEPG